MALNCRVICPFLISYDIWPNIKRKRKQMKQKRKRRKQRKQRKQMKQMKQKSPMM